MYAIDDQDKNNQLNTAYCLLPTDRRASFLDAIFRIEGKLSTGEILPGTS